MNEFFNKLILKEEAYPNGLFPQIPNYKKQGSAFLLVDGVNDNILVDGNTTTREIRQGKYKKLIEISTSSYMEEIRFESASKETSFTFDVYVKAVIQVKNPLIFYNHKNLDVTAYFTNMFSLDVRKITRQYSVLDYDGMDEVLTKKRSSYNNVDMSTGFEYQISVVDAAPGSKAIEYVRKCNEQSLNNEIRKKSKKLISDVAMNYNDAVRAEVVEGRLTEEEAIMKIRNFGKENYEENTKQILELRKNNLLTDAEAREMIKKIMRLDKKPKLTQEEQQNESSNSSNKRDNVLNNLFKEE